MNANGSVIQQSGPKQKKFHQVKKRKQVLAHDANVLSFLEASNYIYMWYAHAPWISDHDKVWFILRHMDHDTPSFDTQY